MSPLVLGQSSLLPSPSQRSPCACHSQQAKSPGPVGGLQVEMLIRISVRTTARSHHLRSPLAGPQQPCGLPAAGSWVLIPTWPHRPPPCGRMVGWAMAWGGRLASPSEALLGSPSVKGAPGCVTTEVPSSSAFYDGHLWSVFQATEHIHAPFLLSGSTLHPPHSVQGTRKPRGCF